MEGKVIMEPEHKEALRRLRAILPGIKTFASRRGRRLDEIAETLTDWEKFWSRMTQEDRDHHRANEAKLYDEIFDNKEDIGGSIDTLRELVDLLKELDGDLMIAHGAGLRAERAYNKYAETAEKPLPKDWD